MITLKGSVVTAESGVPHSKCDLLLFWSSHEDKASLLNCISRVVNFDYMTGMENAPMYSCDLSAHGSDHFVTTNQVISTVNLTSYTQNNMLKLIVHKLFRVPVTLIVAHLLVPWL